MESKTNITKAIIKVMQEVKNIEKNLSVGTGNTAYKGVADKDVKIQIGQAMEKNGLAIIPISVKPNLRIDRWEVDEWDNFKKKEVKKQKQQVFTEVSTKYMLLHESGEYLEIEGYGHGVDSQDKSAGKATTYALKYALLYTFLVPTGDVDDSDETHSKEIPAPPTPPTQAKKELKFLNKNTEDWNKVVKAIHDKKLNSLADIKKYFIISKANEEELIKEFEKTI